MDLSKNRGEMGWCGDAGDGLITAGTLNPCYFNSVAAVFLAIIVAVGAWYQAGVTRTLQSR